MKKRYMVFTIMLILLSVIKVNALIINGCDVIASFKPLSSQDEEKYICKGKEFTSDDNTIYFDGTKEIVLRNFYAYYFTNYETKITLKITGTNNISLLHLTDNKIVVIGSGTLKFKENSYVKKTINGKPVYNFVYNNKMILTANKKIYEGRIEDFEEQYDNLKKINGLPNTYNIKNYKLIKVNDYAKMSSVPVTVSWINKHIETKLSKSEENGYGVIKYIKEETKQEVKKETPSKETKKEPTKEPVKEKAKEPVKEPTKETPTESKKEETKQEEVKNNKLEKDNVILISNENVDSKYTLNVSDLTNAEIAKTITNTLQDLNLISFYDLNVYNGNNIVSMQNGHYTIKIRVSTDNLIYDKYQIVYVSDDGKIKEYIDCYLEDDYIVFETTHLSHYALVGKKKGPIISTYHINARYDENFIFKSQIEITILLAMFILIFGSLMFIYIKNNLLGENKPKNKLKKA